MKTLQLLTNCIYIPALVFLVNGCSKNSSTPTPVIQGIAVTVKDAITSKAISGAEVKVSAANKNDSKPSGSDGICNFESLLQGKYTVTVDADGYLSQTKYPEVSDGQMSPVLFQLELAQMLEISPSTVNFNNSNKTETITFTNRSSQGEMKLSIEGYEKWLNTSESTLTIPAKQQKRVVFTIDSKGLGIGSYKSGVTLNYQLNGNNNHANMTVYLEIPNPQAPSIESTINPNGITQTSADITGTLRSLGSSSITESGICWSESSDPKPEKDSKVVSVGIGELGRPFTLTASSLKEGKTYYTRAYAINASGYGYGNVIPFTTATTPTPPSVTIASATNVNHNSASFSGKVSNNGGTNLTEQGFCWNTTGNPTTANNKTSVSADNSGNFSYKMSNLTTGTTYYVKAYAINGLGDKNPGYSNEEKFTTVATVASITTNAMGPVTATSATSGGNITSDGGANITARGVCWDTKNNPTAELSTKTTDGTGTGSFSSALTGLLAGTTYYVRAYASNNVGTNYGAELNFTTSASFAVLTTNAVSSITSKSAKIGGNISSSGGAVTARGVCWSKSLTPTVALTTKTSDGTGIGNFSSDITGLTENTKYYVRAYAINSAGPAYGNEINFTTPAPFVIGQEYGGGIIFYIDATGEHGLIAAKTDQSVGIGWYNGKYIITGANDPQIGSGQSNTKKIIEVLGEGNYAANLCDKLVFNGYDDWFLPSKKELELLYERLKNGVGGFSDDYRVIYWSSTEGSDEGLGTGAYYKGSTFQGYTGLGYNELKTSAYVRAIRAF